MSDDTEDQELVGEIAIPASLPAFHPAGVKLLRVVQDKEANYDEMQRLIESDPSLTASVLRMANSALFGAPRVISTVRRALVMLGLRHIRSLVVMSCTRQLMQEQLGAPKDEDLAREALGVLWRHSLAVGLVARRLAEHRRHGVEPDEAFVAGVLHDIGKIVMIVHFPVEYRMVLEGVAEGGQAFHPLERETFGFHHGHVGYVLAQRWGFPQVLADVIRKHHRPAMEAPLGSLVALANALCQRPGMSFEGRAVPPELESLAAELGFDLALLEADMLKVEETLAGEVQGWKL